MVLSCCDLGVVVQPESLCLRAVRQPVYVRYVVRKFSQVGGIVVAAGAELVVGLEDVGGDVPLQDGLDEPHIFVVSHSAAVVDF